LGILKIGRVHVDQARWAEAIPWFKEAIQLDPKPSAAHYLLGIVYIETGRHEEAVGPLKEAIRLAPE
jgi:Flp pilus assembly protein TadD